MKYLLDTNVICELTKKNPNKNVIQWFENKANETLYLSVLSFGEIVKGIHLLPKSKKRETLLDWLDSHLLLWFENRLLEIDLSISEVWGKLTAEHKNLPAIDGLIAATASIHHLILVTRNEKDFLKLPIQVVNPFNRIEA